MSLGCVIMASGRSVRYGRNKLLEKLDGKEIILHTAGSLLEAGLQPMAVTRSPEVKALLDREGIACALHDGALKSDTIHEGLRRLPPDTEGFLFIPGDQPLVHVASLRRMADRFRAAPGRALRLGRGETAGSPVLFPAACREALMAYEGDRGGLEVLRREGIPWDLVQAEKEWELWDADTPEQMDRIREAYYMEKEESVWKQKQN